MAKYVCKCGARYSFSKNDVGKQAECKSCGEMITLVDSAIPPAETVALAPQPDGDLVRLSTADSVAAGLSDSPPLVDATLPSRGYGNSVLWAFLFPSDARNLINFFMLWFVVFVGLQMPCFIPIIVAFWLAATLLNIMSNFAAGEEDIPSIEVTADFIGDRLYPAIKMVGSLAVVVFPAILFQWRIGGLFVMTRVGGGLLIFPGGSAPMPVAWSPASIALLIAGLLMWPMVALCFGLGGTETLWRIDLMFVTIARSFGAYLFTLLLIGGSIATSLGLMVAIATYLTPPYGAPAWTELGSSLLIYMLHVGITLYCSIVVMILIGLYYRHFKHKFAWDWE